ncbi:hypothetical protein HZB02_07280 [Candidatus Woesearchaeota archaeon]|nr:hypothetical protein [Candidatus Woesearchaeota archaeon]
MVEYLAGVLNIANLVLALVAGGLALSLLKVSHQQKELRPWKYLIIVLLLFMVEEILGVLRAFGVYNSPYLTHLIPSAILGLLIAVLVVEKQIA